jgi:hypothetical protein
MPTPPKAEEPPPYVRLPMWKEANEFTDGDETSDLSERQAGEYRAPEVSDCDCSCACACADNCDIAYVDECGQVKG